MKNYDLTKLIEMPPKNFVTYGCLIFAVVSLACAIFVFLIPRPTTPSNPQTDLLFDMLYQLGPIICLVTSGFFYYYFFSSLKQKKYLKLINKKYLDGQKVLVRTISKLQGFYFLFLLIDLRHCNKDDNLGAIIKSVIERANKKIPIFGYPIWFCLYDPVKHSQILQEQNELLGQLERLMENHLLHQQFFK